jgi:E1A/CREB-binding protein
MVPPLQLAADADADMRSEFFETRQAFLSLCQGNHYQFDSLRRAKHSSMMVLYHLHNPDAPAFSSMCNFCHAEIEPGSGFRCTVCTDFDMCKNCHMQGMQHEHPMVVSASSSGDSGGLGGAGCVRAAVRRVVLLPSALVLSLSHACGAHPAAPSPNSCSRAHTPHARTHARTLTGHHGLCQAR